jgi:hypothetical protein
MPGSPGSGKGNGMVIVGSPSDGTVGTTDVRGGSTPGWDVSTDGSGVELPEVGGDAGGTGAVGTVGGGGLTSTDGWSGAVEPDGV